jgi:HprK-related kinase A
MLDASIGSLAPQAFNDRLSTDGVGVRFGPFDVRLKVRVQGLAEPLYWLYRDYPLLDIDRVFNCHVDMHDVGGFRSRAQRRVRLSIDGRQPHEDMPAGQSLAVLEWGLNLVIALRFHRFLLLHAAVLERDGGALLLPAAPGHGKTTLCAALAHRGWRFCSDEFGLLRPGSRKLVPLPRPMALKNESIGIMRTFAPEISIGPEIHETIKGTVAHVRPPRHSVDVADREVPARWVVFPRWLPGTTLSLMPVSMAEAFMLLSTNAFNYEVLGEMAFETVRAAIDGARCFRLVYSDLDAAVTTLERLATDCGSSDFFGYRDNR